MAPTADIDGLFAEQVNEQNPRVRKQLLDRAQQLSYQRMVFLPVMGSVFINGGGQPGRNARAEPPDELSLLGALRGPDAQEEIGRHRAGARRSRPLSAARSNQPSQG
jgi:hypothetical protein